MEIRVREMKRDEKCWNDITAECQACFLKLCFLPSQLSPLIPPLAYLPVHTLIFLSYYQTLTSVSYRLVLIAPVCLLSIPFQLLAFSCHHLWSPLLYLSLAASPPHTGSPWCAYQYKGQLRSFIDDILVSRWCGVIWSVQHLLFAAAAVSAL